MTFGLKSYPPDLTMSSAPLLLGDFNPFVLVAARNKSEEWQSNCVFDEVCADLLPAKITGQLNYGDFSNISLGRYPNCKLLS